LQLMPTYTPVRRCGIMLLKSARVRAARPTSTSWLLPGNQRYAGRLKKAMAVLRPSCKQQLAAFVDLERLSHEPVVEQQEDEIDPIFAAPVDDLELTVRFSQLSESRKYYYIGDLIAAYRSGNLLEDSPTWARNPWTRDSRTFLASTGSVTGYAC